MPRGTLQVDNEHRMGRQRVPIIEIAQELGLSRSAIHRLQDIGINTAEELLGLTYVDFEGLAEELDVSPGFLTRAIAVLRKYIPPDVLKMLEHEYHSLKPLPGGAEMGPAPHIGAIDDYDEE